MKKVSLISAFLGTMIEVYDFSVFAFLIPILSEVFIPFQAKNTAMNFTILAYVISYGIKPFGAIGFGYLIDRYGRKNLLLYTTLLMTFATAAIGLLPHKILGMYHGAGLIVCRIIQGLAISGEFSSAIILTVEQGKGNPAFSGSLSFMGGILGLLLANLSAFILLYVMPHDLIVQYAWRIPFLIGTICCLVLFYIRNKIDDFVPGLASRSAGFVDLIRNYKKELITTFIVSSLSGSAFYMTFIYMPTALSVLLNRHTHQQAVLITLITLSFYLVALPLGGILADRIGIVRQIKIASFLYLLFAYVCFAILAKLNTTNCIIVLTLFAIIQALLNSALPAFMIAQFLPNQRGKALAISYNISLTIFAGLMPYLILTSGNYINPGIPISICAILSLLALHLIKVKKHGYL